MAANASAFLLCSYVVIVVLMFTEDTQALQLASIRWAFFFWLSEMAMLLGLLLIVQSRLQP